MNLKEWKGAMIAAFSVINAWLGNLAIPVYLLLALNILDYITGLTAAPYRGQTRNSYSGVRGIAKKVCTLLLVPVAAVVDWLLVYAGAILGLESPVRLVVASLTAVWLICNEMLSVLENIGDIGVKLPPFLERMVEWVREKAEESGARP